MVHRLASSSDVGAGVAAADVASNPNCALGVPVSLSGMRDDQHLEDEGSGGWKEGRCSTVPNSLQLAAAHCPVRFPRVLKSYSTVRSMSI